MCMSKLKNQLQKPDWSLKVLEWKSAFMVYCLGWYSHFQHISLLGFKNLWFGDQSIISSHMKPLAQKSESSIMFTNTKKASKWLIWT